MTLKLHHHCLKKRDVHATFLITSGKQMSKSYGSGFNKIEVLI